MGQLKYNLNLDEAAVKSFYQAVKDASESFGDEEQKGQDVLTDMFKNQIGIFKARIEEWLENESVESQYMIPQPWALRGALIIFMNDALDEPDMLNEL